MREVNASILGMAPVHSDVRIGGDGQLWRFTDRGQVTVASGGSEALAYAQANGFPANVVELLRGMDNAARYRANGGRL